MMATMPGTALHPEDNWSLSKPTKILVTGGAGFIGTNLCATLRSAGHEVTAFDNLSVSNANVALLESLGVSIVVGDVSNFEEVLTVAKDNAVIFHLAAMNRAQRSIDQPIIAHHANITGTLHVLEAARRFKARVVFVSSSSVYAGRDGLLQEDSALAPLHPYGVGKLAGEHYARVYHELFGLPVATLRLFSVYGPYQLGTIDKAGVVAKYIHNARTGAKLPVYGEGQQLRNFTYVSDVVRSLILAANSDKANGKIINIANPHEVSVLELAKAIASATKTQSEIAHEAALKGDPARNPADVTRARELLEYVPQVSLESGIAQTVAWYDSQARSKH